MDQLRENKHLPSLVISRFLLCFVTGLLIGMIISFILQLTGVTDKKILIVISHLGLFILPAVIFGYWHYRNDMLKEFSLRTFPGIRLAGLGILLLLVAVFFTQYIYGVNKMLPLPEWMISEEAAKEAMTLELLAMDNWKDLVINMIVVGCLPALGEELIFRGILQKYLIRWTRRAWIGIVASAILFSAIHMQFQGFLPRVFLGILLGYAFWVSGSLWLAIFLHFVNNGAQVVMYYLYLHGKSTLDISEGVEVSWISGMGSLVITLVVMWMMYLFRPSRNAPIRTI